MTSATLGVDWLAVLERQASALETVAAGTPLDAPVPDCAGWDVAELLGHVGAVHRMVVGWTTTGRRLPGAAAPTGADVLRWYGQGWRELVAHLSALSPGTVVPTWHPVDDTAAFWHRRMAHETAVHALDAHRAARAEDRWDVDAAVASDGVDEALRTFLGGRLGEPGGDGALVQVRVPGRWWAVSLHRSVVEVGEPAAGPFAELVPDAVVRGPAAHVYRWVWGRGGDVIESGDHAAVTRLREALAQSTQ